MVGLLTAANSTGQLIFLPLMSHIEMEGWRWVMAVPAAAALIALPVAGLLMRDRPSDLGIPPYGGTAVEPPRVGAPASSAVAVLLEAVKTGTFWALAVSFFVCGATTVGLIAVHFIPAAHDHGMPATTAAGMLAVMGILDIAGTTASGWLTDRMDPRKLLFWYYALRGVSLVLLSNALTTQSYTLVLFVAFYGLDWIATVPPTVALVARRFGTEKSGIVFGWVFTFHQLGGAAAAYGAGLVRGWNGDYLPVFIASGVLCGIAALVVLRIPRAPRRSRALAGHRARHALVFRGVSSEEIDALDSRLLLELRANPRVGVVEISRRLGVARGTVQARMDKLAARGVITGFGPEVEPAQMGYPVLAFISLEIVQGRLEEAVATLERVPEVLEVHGVTGDRDLLCRVVARDNTHLQDVINAMLHTGAVQRSTSAISMTRQIPYRIEPLIAAAGTDR